MKNRIKNISVLLVLSALLLSAGCAGIGRHVEEPEVTLTDMQVVEMRPLEAVFQIALRVMNPNDFGLDIRGVRCDLKIDGRHFATGVGDQKSEIPAYGTGLVPVKVYASTLKMFSSVLAMVQGMSGQQNTLQPIRYELSGTIRMGGGINRTVPFHSKGELALNK